MDLLAGWPDWLVWCTAVAGALLAVAAVVGIIEAALDMDNR